MPVASKRTTKATDNKSTTKHAPVAKPPLVATYFVEVPSPPRPGPPIEAGPGGIVMPISPPVPPIDIGPGPENVGVAGLERESSQFSVRVTFAESVRPCAFATSVTDAEGGQAAVFRTDDRRTLNVWTWDVKGNPAPRSFQLLVFCPPS